MSIAHCSYGIKPGRCLSVNATLHCLAQIGSEGSTRRENRSFHHSNKTRPGRTLDKLTSPCSPEHSKEVICGGKDVFFSWLEWWWISCSGRLICFGKGKRHFEHLFQFQSTLFIRKKKRTHRIQKNSKLMQKLSVLRITRKHQQTNTEWPLENIRSAQDHSRSGLRYD